MAASIAPEGEGSAAGDAAGQTWGRSARRGVLASLGSAGDIVVNYPMWILAKRLAAGLGWPRRPVDFYKGAGLLWISQGPTIACEDFGSRTFVPFVQWLAAHSSLSLGPELEHAAAAALAGACTGALVASPTENVVTRAHKYDVSTVMALKGVVREGGVKGTLLPRGVMAMVCREIPFSLGLFYLKDRAGALCHDAIGSSSSSSYAAGGSSICRWLAAEAAASLGTATMCGVVSHPASVILAQQQAHNLPLGQALRETWTKDGLRGFYRGFLARNISICGSLFVIPLVLAQGSRLGLE